MPVTDLIKVQMGQEATWGTAVAATAKLMGVTEATLNIVEEVHQTEKAGAYYPSDLVAEVAFSAEGSIKMDLSYEDILYPLENFFDCIETHTAATGPYSWNYAAPTGTTVAPQFLTIEFGAPSAEYEASGALFTDLNISGEAGGIWIGDFPFIAEDADDGTMATGISDRAVELIRMADTTINIDTWSGSYGGGGGTHKLISFELNVQSGRHLKQFGGSVQPTDWGDRQWTGTLTTVLEYSADTKAIVDALLAPGLQQRLIEIAAASAPRSATIQFAGTLVDGVKLFDDRDGNVTVSLKWQGTYNDTVSGWFDVDIVNSVKTVP